MSYNAMKEKQNIENMPKAVKTSQEKTPAQTVKQQPKVNPVLNLNQMGYHAIDKTAEAVTDQLDKLDQQKPGTRRNVIGLTMLGGGLTSAGIGAYLLLS